MGENSKIEWTSHTFNPWRGCTKVSEGCTNCYADVMSSRNPSTLGVWGKYGTRVVASESMWRNPYKWNAMALEMGERHRVFCSSLADVFEGRDTMPESAWEAVDRARVRLFETIDQTESLDWLLLTKRPENIIEIMGDRTLPDNVWVGTSVENQKTADERIPDLLKVNATVRFLSCEPLLGGVKFSQVPGFNLVGQAGVDMLRNFWVIVGCESGGSRRPMELDWAYSIAHQCKVAKVPVFIKQLQLGGKVVKDIDKFPLDLQIREFPRV